jgi:hypothetical protein
MPIIKIHNVETGEVIEREMTDEEIEQRDTDQALEAIKAVEAKAKASEKAALLNRLGISEEEAKLLLS